MTRSQGLFFGALALVTVLPFFALALDPLPSGPLAESSVLLVWGLASSGHVGGSWVASYVDPDYAPLRRRAIAALLLAPLIAIGLFLAAGEWVATGAAVGFILWGGYHSQRQNYGLVAFAAGAARAGKLPAGVSRALTLAGVAGAIGLLRLLPVYPGALHPAIGGLLTPPLVAGLHVLAAGLFVGAGIWLALALYPLRRSPLVGAFALLGWLFFTPTLLTDAPLMAWGANAIAHGLQYFVMCGISAFRSRRGGVAVTAVAALAGGYFLVAHALGSSLLWPVFIGLSVAHYVTDAQLWRLSAPLQGQIVRQRFAFALAH